MEADELVPPSIQQLESSVRILCHPQPKEYGCQHFSYTGSKNYIDGGNVEGEHMILVVSYRVNGERREIHRTHRMGWEDGCSCQATSPILNHFVMYKYNRVIVQKNED